MDSIITFIEFWTYTEDKMICTHLECSHLNMGFSSSGQSRIQIVYRIW